MSNAQNPSHVYTLPGTYTVTLTATNADGSDSVSKAGVVVVSTAGAAPVADFTASQVSGTAPMTVNFTDTSTNTPTSWAWDFQNNGSTDSTVRNPSFTYTTAGTYSVKLTATNATGSDVKIKTNLITVAVPAATAISLLSLPPTDRETLWVQDYSDSVHSVLYQGTWYQFIIYAVYFSDTDAHPFISRRTLPDGTWQAGVDLKPYLRSIYPEAGKTDPVGGVPLGYDNHNNITVMVDTSGYIHVVGNHHYHSLRYCRSNVPISITGGWTPRRMTNSPYEWNVTYPQLFKARTNGRLYCTWRHIERGSGDPTPGDTGNSIQVLFKLSNPATPTWVSAVSGQADGLWLDGRATPRGVYMSRVATDDNGVLHAMWAWRNITYHAAALPDQDVFHFEDMSYAKSTTEGATWLKADGSAQTVPITPINNTAIIGTQADVDVGLNPPATVGFDSNQRPHCLVEYAQGGPGRGWRHVYRNTADTAWTITTLPTTPWDAVGTGTPRLLRVPGNRMFALLDRTASANSPRCVNLTPGAADYGGTDRIIADIPTLFAKNMYDTEAVRFRDELYFYTGPSYGWNLASPIPAAQMELRRNHQRQWAGVIRYDLDQWDEIINREFPLPNIDVANTATKTTSQAFSSSTPTTVTGLTGPPVVWDTYGAGNPSGVRKLFVRLTATASVSTSGTQLHMAVAETGASVVDTGLLIFDTTSVTTRSTPWVPLRVLGTSSAYQSAPFVRAWRGAGSGTGTIAASPNAKLEFGVLNYFETGTP